MVLDINIHIGNIAQWVQTDAIKLAAVIFDIFTPLKNGCVPYCLENPVFNFLEGQVSVVKHFLASLVVDILSSKVGVVEIKTLQII
jgi:hypothetical protein